MLKSKIRKKILSIRKRNNYKNIKFSFKKIFSEIEKNISKKKGIIGGYYPVNFEIDVMQFLNKLENKGFKLSLPVIKKDNEMDFYNWSFNDLLILNKFGIPEPEQNKKVIPNIILVPLVAFDSRLYRIGYGGGYYDRYIAKFLNKETLFKVGIAHSCQKINRVPINNYDKRLDIIITEKYVLK